MSDPDKLCSQVLEIVNNCLRMYRTGEVDIHRQITVKFKKNLKHIWVVKMLGGQKIYCILRLQIHSLFCYIDIQKNKLVFLSEYFYLLNGVFKTFTVNSSVLEGTGFRCHVTWLLVFT